MKMKDNLLICDCCKLIEQPPFVEGDKCFCGGIFKKYKGHTIKNPHNNFIYGEISHKIKINMEK